jgi:hypothetical protein
VNIALATIETSKLAKLIRLIFGSDNDGEVIAAVAALRRALASAGLDAHWLADIVERRTNSIAAPAADDRRERDERSDAWFCFHHRDELSPRERAFIENVVRWSSPLSPKQRKWIHDIADRLHCEAAV